MSLFTVFKIAAQGMSAQRERLEAASSNLANSNTTRTLEGGPYRRRDVIFEVAPVEAPGQSDALFGSALSSAEQAAQGVQATTLVTPDQTGIKIYRPDHPDANKEGYVTMPDVDPLEETVNMLSAARSFEANASAFQTAKEMVRASLKLGEV
jgi:flagellar basal-body rod protein FlgC